MKQEKDTSKELIDNWEQNLKQKKKNQLDALTEHDKERTLDSPSLDQEILNLAMSYNPPSIKKQEELLRAQKRKSIYKKFDKSQQDISRFDLQNSVDTLKPGQEYVKPDNILSQYESSLAFKISKKRKELSTVNMQQEKQMNPVLQGIILENKHKNINKKLLNSMLVDRIQYKLNTNEKEQNINGLSLFDDNSKLFQEVRDAFKSETNQFQQILHNFKNLVNNHLVKSNQFLKYEDILRTLVLNKLHEKDERQMKKKEQEMQTLKKQDSEYLDNQKQQLEEHNFKFMEKKLLSQYIGLENEFYVNDQKLQQARKELADLNNKLKEIKQEYELNLVQIEKQISQDIQRSIKQDIRKKTILNNFLLKRETDDQSQSIKTRLAKLQQKKDDIIQTYQEQHGIIENQLKKYTDNYKNATQELEKLKERKSNIKSMLKDLYLRMLKQRTVMSQQSLVWIVMALLRINEDITQNNIFPEYLDQMSIEYLIEQAQLEIRLDQLQGHLNESKNQDESLNSQQNIRAHNSSLEQIKTNINEKIMSQIIKTQRPIARPKSKQNEKNFIIEMHDIPIKQYCQNKGIAFDITQFSPSYLQNVQNNQEIMMRMNKILIALSKIKDLQIQRLFQEYMTGQSQKCENMKEILYSLFGNTEGDYLNMLFQREKCFQIENADQKKTFTFSQVSKNKIKNNFQGQQRSRSLENKESDQVNKLNQIIQKQSSKNLIYLADRRVEASDIKYNSDMFQQFGEKQVNFVNLKKDQMQKQYRISTSNNSLPQKSNLSNNIIKKEPKEICDIYEKIVDKDLNQPSVYNFNNKGIFDFKPMNVASPQSTLRSPTFFASPRAFSQHTSHRNNLTPKTIKIENQMNITQTNQGEAQKQQQQNKLTKRVYIQDNRNQVDFKIKKNNLNL